MEIPKKIPLLPDEIALYETIPWSQSDIDALSRDELNRALDNMANLFLSLLNRKAIPKCRRAFLIDKERNGGKKSRWQAFRGTEDERIRHPDFRKYLFYFVNGPKLPESTIREVARILEEEMGTSAMIDDTVCKFIRKEIRERRIEFDSPDEFEKLAFEIGREDLAESMRKAAMDGRRQR